jgi:hypothetical protein
MDLLTTTLPTHLSKDVTTTTCEHFGRKKNVEQKFMGFLTKRYNYLSKKFNFFPICGRGGGVGELAPNSYS